MRRSTGRSRRSGSLAIACALGVALTGGARADTLESRVMVLPSEGDAPASLVGLGEELSEAMTRGARRMTTSVARAAASLGDTAVVVGCDPAGAECLEAVAAALNVDQLLIVRMSPAPGGASVEVTAVTREAEPVTRSFVVHAATRKADLAAIEKAVPEMLEAGESKARGGGPAGGGGNGNGGDERMPPPPPPPPLVVEPTLNKAPLFVAGGGALVAIAGGVFWALAAKKQDEIDGAPTDTAAQLAALEDLEDRARTQALVGNVLVIGGAVAIGASAVWFLTTRSSGGEVTVTPTASPGGAGVVLGGRW